ncbi:GNAT family N-acetyltransferase [Kribbella pittospori]|uniref:GNAT family N-acetyltransferase n=1 Tax=Kribbella pittospori TaxID=722689 RepID=UPI001EDF6693|nr:GNAT family N-acetyltransferase [Kribbella pittospori]
MTGTGPEDALAGAFEQQRDRLVAVAYRMLGSRVDAEDAVQEAWLRLARQDADSIDNLAGWLTTVVGRVCIDVLRSRKARPEVSYEDQLPDLVVTEDDGVEDSVLAESVGPALLVVLDALRPDERLAFVLHDMFAVPFAEIGQILGRSTDAAKMLASRARRKVQDTHPPPDEPTKQRAVVEAFLAAARSGDFEGRLRVLDPDVTWRAHTARGVVIRLGATEVAARALRGAETEVSARPVLVNGRTGILSWRPNGDPLSVMACTVVDGRIVEILSVSDPARLATMSLPPRPGVTDRGAAERRLPRHGDLRSLRPLQLLNQLSSLRVVSVAIEVLDEITDEVEEAFGRLMPQLSASAGPLDREALERLVSCETNTVLLARSDDGIVGTLTLVMFPIPTGLRARIEDVVVDDAARGQGVGAALTEDALRIARLAGAKTVDLTSRPSRAAANRLYQRLGFQPRESQAYRFTFE